MTPEERRARGLPVSHLDFANLIHSRVDIVEVIGQHTKLEQRKPEQYTGPCPFCGIRVSFWVHSGYQMFRCATCCRKGDVFTFVEMTESVDFHEAVRRLAVRAGLELPKDG